MIFKKHSAKTFFYGVSIFFVIAYVVLAYISRGKIFSKTFFVTERFQHWGDFFQWALQAASHKNPYEWSNMVVPPVATLFYRFFGILMGVANASDWEAARDSQYGAMIYTELICVSTVVLIYALENLLKKQSKHECYILAIILLVSQPFMGYAIKQGNPVYSVMVLITLTLCLRNSPNRVYKELALVCIAVTANMKIFPTLLGCLYIKEKRWAEGIRCAVYGSLLFFLPFFYYGFTESFFPFLEQLNYHNTIVTSPGTVPHIVSSICIKLHHTAHMNSLMAVSSPLYLLFILFIFFRNKTSFSNTYLFYSLFVVLGKTQQPYCLVYFTIPIIAWLNYINENREERLSPFDFVMPISFCGMLFCYNWYIEYAFVWLGIVYCAAIELRIALKGINKKHLVIVMAAIFLAIVSMGIFAAKPKYKSILNPITEYMVEAEISTAKYNVDSFEKNYVYGWFYCGEEYEVYVKSNEKFYKLKREQRDDVTSYLGIDKETFTGFSGYFRKSKDITIFFVDSKNNCYYKITKEE